MDNLEYIDHFFTNERTPAGISEFENRVVSDVRFAEDVAFYLKSREALQDQDDSRNRFRTLYQKQKSQQPSPVRKLLFSLVAAAAVAGIVFGIYYFSAGPSPQKMAGSYITDHFASLGVTMGTGTDSLQTGLKLFNEGNFSESLVYFEKIVRSDTADFTAKKYAGISALRLKAYNKALYWFGSLEKHDSLYANPALFYQAVTLMERNQPGDLPRAKELLMQVVKNDQEGKETAQQWLRKW